jgi:hypothetical protein
VAVVAVLVGTLLTGLAWHDTRLDTVDAWVMRWQELAHPHGGRVAAIVSGTLLPVMLMTMVAGAALAWLAGRRDAVVLALAAAPATLAAEMLLKELVHRQWHGDPDLLFPSGHSAVAIAAAMTAVLVLRVVPVARPARVAAACLGGGFVLVIAVARLPRDGAFADRRRGWRHHRTGGDPRRGVGDHNLVPAGTSPGVLRRFLEVDDPSAPGACQRRS